MRLIYSMMLCGLVTFATCAFKAKTFLQYENKDAQKFDEFNANGADLNLQPVIGILAQTLEPEMLTDPRFENYTYYVMSSFVKFLEGAGARIVPLVPSMSQEETFARLQKLNGVFLPGGDGDYNDYARYIYGKLIELNDQGMYLPMWGTCMGYESIANFSASNGDPNEIMYLTHTSLPLQFVMDPRDSQMYS